MAHDRHPGSVRSGIVRRPVLMQQLERAAAGPVTLVVAPAGSGKSTLVRSWLEYRSAATAAWVAVERGERDAQRFWGSLVDALRAAAPGGPALEVPSPTPEFDGHGLVRRLVGELASLPGRLVLVLDDVHELVGADIQEQLARFLENLPAALHVVLIARRDPRLGLHRHRLTDGLAEVRNAELRFTLDETRELLAAAGTALSDGGVELLHDRTEGWAAGLRLAALALLEARDPELFVVQFSGSERTVAEYLLAEVLDGQPPEVRRLLVRASLFDRVNGPLGDLLTGGSGAERQLRALADAGGFVVALDEGRTWFRMHHLFADLLADELRHREAEEIPRLHRVAAQWFAQHGDAIEAVTHAQSAGDLDLAAEVLIDHYFSLVLDGRRASAHTLLAAFSPALEVVPPEIVAVLAAEKLSTGSLEQAADYLALAERNGAAVPPGRRHRFRMALLVNRISLARRLGDAPSVLGELQQAGAPSQAGNARDVSLESDVRALVLMNVGIAEVWGGRTDEGMHHLAQARDLARKIGRPYLEVGSQAHLAQATTFHSFTRAREEARAAIDVAESHGWGADPVIGPALVTLAISLLQAGRLDEADLWLARADRTVPPDPEPAAAFMVKMAHGAAHTARGRHAAALASYREAGGLGLLLLTRSQLALQLRSATLHALLALDRPDDVRQVLATLDEAERDTGELREMIAALALAEGDPATTSSVLLPTLDGRAAVHHRVVIVRSLLLEGRARDIRGDVAGATEAVEQALDLAHQDGLVLPFIHRPSKDLLERHPRHRTAHGAFLQQILDIVSGQAPPLGRPAPAPALGALSDAELRVLRYLPTNLPAGGIATAIGVSVHTVKTHMRHIYAKVEAHDRAQAVDRARELGLLGQARHHS